MKRSYIFLILLLGIFLRLWAFFHNYGINPDATLYLYQTWALAKGNFSLLKICAISSRIKEINLFSVSIVPFFYIFKNLEIAGKCVSFIASSLSLCFLYFILKRYFKGLVLYLTLLIYAIHPILIKESSEILRESLFSFYFLIGLWSFLKGLEVSNKWKGFYLMFSSITWILSAWIRIEGLFFVIFSGIYLFGKLLFTSDKKEALKNLFWFLILPLIGFILGLIYLSYFKGFIITEWLSKAKITNPFTQPYRKVLKTFEYKNIPAPSPYFWDMVRQNLWLIALGTTLFYKFIPALYAPNLIFLLAGFKNLKNNLKKHQFLFYFLSFSIFYIIILWFFAFTHWYMEKRYMLPLIYLLSPFLGLGIENLINWFKEKFSNLSYQKIVTIVCLYIVIFSLPKSMASIRKRKLGIKKIGVEIAKYLPKTIENVCKTTRCESLIFTSKCEIIFFAGNAKGFMMCPKFINSKFYYWLSQRPEKFIKYIKNKNYKFVVLEERYLKRNLNIVKEKLIKEGYKFLKEEKIISGKLVLLGKI